MDTSNRVIAIELDETRDPTPMNSGQRMARLALGAALENIYRAAESLNWRVEPEEPPLSALAAVRIVDATGRQGHDEVDPAISRRVTNRRVYEGRPVSGNVIEELKRTTPDRDGIRTIWIHEPDRLKQLAAVIGRSDALMLGEPSMRQGFLDNIRFDLPCNGVAEEGMSLGTLELNAADRLAVRLLRFVPNWIFQAFGASAKFATTAKRLVASSAGLCIVTENAGSEQKELQAGRAMQRAWLKLTELGLAAQPMMSLAILESILERGSESLLRSLGKNRTEKTVAEFRELLSELDDDNVAFIARFGYAKSPTCTTGRLPIEANTRTKGDAVEAVASRAQDLAARNQS